MGDGYTEDMYELFKNEVKHWLALFGLHDWRVLYDCEVIDEAFAQVHPDVPGRVALFRYNKNNKDCPYLTREQVRRTAFHEVMELMVHEILYTCEHYNLSARQKEHLESVKHGFIRRMEYVLFDEMMRTAFPNELKEAEGKAQVFQTSFTNNVQ